MALIYSGLAFSILDHYGGPNTYSDCSFKDGFLFLINDRIVLPVSSQLRYMCKKKKSFLCTKLKKKFFLSISFFCFFSLKTVYNRNDELKRVL